MTDLVIDAPAPATATPAPAPAQTPAAPAAADNTAAPKQVAGQQPPDAPGADKPPAGPKWPENWRAELAGDDEKLLKRLERLDSLAALAKTVREQDKLIGAAKFQKPLTKDATPEQIAEWREANGIPADPAKYDTKLPDGLVFGDEDKPAVDSYLKAMHGVNATPEQVKAGLGAYAAFRNQEAQALAELDNAEKTALRDELASDWGANFSHEVARIESLFATAPEGVRDLVMGARSGKSGLMNNPKVVRWLSSVARELNPTATLVPAGGSREGAIADELKAIKASRWNADGTESKAYWSKTTQQREAQLIAALEKLK